jgi:hypothetical protein
VDAVLLLPLISTLRLGTANLLASVDSHPRTHQVEVGTTSRHVISTYDRGGKLRSRTTTHASTVTAPVLPGGFTVIV